ncbi:CMRF35-like molecule 7 isoform X2 [Esox lucius]|uniref:CMRF35-like molecule 7 isoform X2 n=1 Tax=Esox lucius TaxID=8010 RepID=UPI0014774927|nr:CMRF35-like molecule 7 isoform X2 [Esox lucius]
MNILHFVSCCLLSGLCVEASPFIREEVEGGFVTFPCSFSWASSNNKYFCNETCSAENILVETKGNRNVTEGRYSIHDFGDGVFFVTIKDLKKSDSGTYWCGVESVGADTYQELYLTVTDYVFVGTTDAPKTGLMVWTSVSLVVMVTVMGLVLALLCIKRRGCRRSTSPQLVYKNTNTAPSGEVDRLYANTRTPKKERYTVPRNSPNASTTYPADHASKSYPADHASTIYPADHTSTIYPPGHTSSTRLPGHTSTTYPAGQVTSSSHFEIYVNVTDLNVLCDSCVM